MSVVWYIFEKGPLALYRYISSSSSGLCCKWAKDWFVCLSKGIVEYCLYSSLLQSFHIKYIKQTFILWAEVSGDPIIFEICAAFYTGVIHDSHLLLLPSNVSTKEISTWMMGCYTITEVTRLASLQVPVTWWLKARLGLYTFWCWLSWEKLWSIKVSDCNALLSA